MLMDLEMFSYLIYCPVLNELVWDLYIVYRDY